MIRTSERFLTPATNEDFHQHLGPMLTLIAPTGMNEAARTEWLRVAADTLNGIPVDLLASSCREARYVVDHPAKVMPFIGREVREEWEERKKHHARLLMLEVGGDPAAPAPAIEDNSPLVMDVAEVAALTVPLRRMGLGQGWLTQAMLDEADAWAAKQEQSDAA